MEESDSSKQRLIDRIRREHFLKKMTQPEGFGGFKHDGGPIIAGGRGLVGRVQTGKGERRALKMLELEIAHAEDVNVAMREMDAMVCVAGEKTGHMNVVRHYGDGCGEGILYVVLEWLEGETLAKRIARRALSPRGAVDIAHSVAEALDHLHARGVVHRDVTPNNVMLVEGGRTVLFDLGFADVSAPNTLYPAPISQFCGTPRFLAPEQASGELARVTVDVFGLGSTLWCALDRLGPYQEPSDTRQFPDREERDGQILRRVFARKIRAFPELPGVSEALRTAIIKATAPDPADRFQTIFEFAEALRSALASLP